MTSRESVALGAASNQTNSHSQGEVIAEKGAMQLHDIGTQQLKKQVEEITERIENNKKELNDIKKDFITIFGIFAAFLTYVSVEVQILQAAHDLFVLSGLSLFFLAAMLLFAITLNNLVKDNDSWENFKRPTFCVFYGLLVLSMISFACHFIKIDSSFVAKDFYFQVSFLTKSAS